MGACRIIDVITLCVVLLLVGSRAQMSSYQSVMEDLPRRLQAFQRYKDDKRMVDFVRGYGLPFFHGEMKRALQNATDHYQVIKRLGLTALLSVIGEDDSAHRNQLPGKVYRQDTDGDVINPASRDRARIPIQNGVRFTVHEDAGPLNTEESGGSRDVGIGRISRRTGSGNQTGMPGSVPYLHRSKQVSGACRHQLVHFINSLVKMDWWALKMLDAWGKTPSGVLEGNMRAFGSLRECSKLDYTPTKQGQGLNDTGGKGLYCAADIRFLDDGSHVVMVSMTQGLCLPPACTDEDVDILLDHFLAVTKFERIMVSKNVLCQRKNLPNATAIGAIAAFVFLVVVVLVGTLLDFALPPSPSDRSSMHENGHGNALSAQSVAGSINAEIESNEYQPLLQGYSRGSALRTNTGLRLLLCFSAKTNVAKLMDTGSRDGESLACICGMRVLTISWIVAGHTILFNTSRGANFIPYVQDKAPDPGIQLLINSTFACDTFLVFSGLLVCYNVMKGLEHLNGKMKWHLFYLHRYLRLTPPMMIVLFIFAATYQYWERAPLWPSHGLEDTNQCRDTWWYNLLYINNMTHKQCMRWTWYLAVDTQLYVISPIFVVLLYRKRVLGLALLLLAGVVSLVVTAVVSYRQRLLPSGFYVMDSNETMLGDVYTGYYYATWCRWNPYLIGIASGYLLQQTNHKLTIHWAANALGWLVCVATTSAILFGLTRSFILRSDLVPMTLVQSVAYITLTRTAWGACVAWVIVMCSTGNGGPVNAFLSLPVLKPLSRLTYMAYLVHEIVLMWHVMGSQEAITLSDINMVVYFFSYLAITYALAALTSLMWEAPFMAMEKMIFTIPRQKGESSATSKRNNSPIDSEQN